MGKKYDSDIVGWFTRGGKRIPRRDKRSTYQRHKDAVKELSDTDKYEDGTYDVKTLKPVEFEDGYQVTFWQIGDGYSDEEYAMLSDMMSEKSSDGKVYAGAFTDGGVRAPEISWHFADRGRAIAIAKKYNQVSIWDWSIMDAIETGGTGRR